MTRAASIAVICGGLSFEREVSLRSGRRVAEALGAGSYLVTPLDADGTLLERLSGSHFDAAFLALHGRFGEDGTVSGLLELLGLPHTGSGFDASRLAFDKLASKSLLRRQGIAVPDAFAIGEVALRELGVGALLDRAVEELGGFPLVVKPNRGGSALGVRLVQEPGDLPDALIAAFGYDDMVMLERWIDGTELAVAIVEGMGALPPVEIRPKGGWYDFASRYTHGAADFLIPAAVSPAATGACNRAAQAAHVALGCRDLSRTDIILDKDATPWVLEVNTGPGLTETSLVPMAAEASGVSFQELASQLTERALARPRR